MGLEEFGKTETTNSNNGSSSIDYISSVEYTPPTREELSKRHISSKKDYNAEYEEDYLRECWNCGWRSIKLSFLNKLGDVWYCTNTECRKSVHAKCNDSTNSFKLADKLDAQKIHEAISSRQADPSKMGLDDFTSSSSSSSSSSGSTDSSNSKSEAHGGGGDSSSSVKFGDDLDLEFYGSGNADIGVNPMERKGAMSDISTSDLVQTSDGTLEFNYDNAKLYLPMFLTITSDNGFSSGERYQMKYTDDGVKPGWNGRVAVCINSVQTTLGELNKEVIMFSAGSPSKKHVMNRVESKLGSDVDGSTEIYINYFGNTMFMRDVAQASELFKEGNLVDIEQIGNRVFKKNMLRIGIESKESND